MLTAEQLETPNKLDFKKLDRTGLVDIRGIQIDVNLPAEQRMKKYLEQVKNPYCFLCGDTTVHIRFDPMGDELKNKLKIFLIR